MSRLPKRVRSSSLFSLLTRGLMLLAVILPLTSCQTEPITGRRVFYGAIGEPQINAMGVEAYATILKDAKRSTNAEHIAMVERVGKRIAAVVNKRMDEAGRERFQWEFTVIDEPTVNAFALPGGKIAFYTGIIEVCQDEAGIAVVMGHEVAHAYQEHGRKRVSTLVLAQATLEAAEAALSSSTENETLRGLTMGALGLGVQFGGLAFSRSDESAADHGGLILMAEAGYDPRPAVDFWKRMSAASGGEAPPEFMSTHPHHDTRINDLQEKMPKALAIYERTKGGN